MSLPDRATALWAKWQRHPEFALPGGFLMGAGVVFLLLEAWLGSDHETWGVRTALLMAGSFVLAGGLVMGRTRLGTTLFAALLAVITGSTIGWWRAISPTSFWGDEGWVEVVSQIALLAYGWFWCWRQAAWHRNQRRIV